MKEYEDQKYGHWTEGTEQMLPLLLRKPLLMVVTGEAANHINQETSEQVREENNIPDFSETYLMFGEIFQRMMSLRETLFFNGKF